MTRNMIAVTVTYNVDEEFADSLASYVLQVSNVIIVDNSTEVEAIKLLGDIVQPYGERVKLISNGDNFGLAKAQNIGIRAALSGGAEWVLLMDDDSKASPDMVEALAQAPEEYALPGNVVICAAHFKDQAVGRKARYVVAPNGKFGRPRFAIEPFSDRPCVNNLFMAISSGSLIRSSLFKEIGLIREPFGIDYLDVDFCLRAVLAGFRIVAVQDAVLYHNLGAQTEHKKFGKDLVAWNHSVRRRYTIYRNRSRVWRNYALKTPGFIIFDILAAGLDLYRIMMVEEQRMAKLWVAIKGVAVGVFGVNSLRN